MTLLKDKCVVSLLSVRYDTAAGEWAACCRKQHWWVLVRVMQGYEQWWGSRHLEEYRTDLDWIKYTESKPVMFYETRNPTAILLKRIPWSQIIFKTKEPFHLSVQCWKLYLIKYKLKQRDAFLIARTLQRCKSRNRALPGLAAPLSQCAGGASYPRPTALRSSPSLSLRCACAGEASVHGEGQGCSALRQVGVEGRRAAPLPPHRAAGALRAPRKEVAVWVPAPSLSITSAPPAAMLYIATVAMLRLLLLSVDLWEEQIVLSGLEIGNFSFVAIILPQMVLCGVNTAIP